MTPTLRISGVGKRFELGERVAYRVLSDALRDVTARAGGRLTGGRVGSTTQGPGRAELWALRDVSLDVEAGEVVGIIGQNGAGKSTLLKILSRITPPTEGRVEVCGRMGSLLEVGTGFHPELTGRENIYLNGIIMGMTRREVDRKFDEIVDFAQVEAFLDTPVKRYSSGMHVRLGFAVAANLEPEILIVDEVLAVGDADFQRKCLARLHDTAKGGRTVLFVSHNMNAVQRLCTRCVLLAEGRLVDDATPSTVVAHYLSSGGRAAAPGEVLDVAGVARRRGGHALRVVAASYASPADAPGHHAYTGGPLNVTLALESDIPRVVNSVAVILYDQAGVKLVNADTLAIGETLELRGGTTEVRFEIAALHLNPGTYTIGWWVADAFGTVYDFVDTGFRVEVLDSVRGFGVRPGADGVVECAFGISRLTEEGRLADGARIRAASAPEAAGTPPAQRD